MANTSNKNNNLSSTQTRRCSKLSVGKSEGVIGVNGTCQERHYRASGLVQRYDSDLNKNSILILYLFLEA